MSALPTAHHPYTERLPCTAAKIVRLDDFPHDEPHEDERHERHERADGGKHPRKIGEHPSPPGIVHQNGKIALPFCLTLHKYLLYIKFVIANPMSKKIWLMFGLFVWFAYANNMPERTGHKAPAAYDKLWRRHAICVNETSPSAYPSPHRRTRRRRPHIPLRPLWENRARPPRTRR